MDPVEPLEVIPAVLPVLKVPPLETTNAPVPPTIEVPISTVDPLATVSVALLPTVIVPVPSVVMF